MVYFLKRLSPFFLIFLLLQFVIRTIFVGWEWENLGLLDVLTAYSAGAFFDSITFTLFSLPYIIYLACVPHQKYGKKFDVYFTHILFLLVIGGLVFDVVAEYTFWQEFAVRFNFIAVDYLIYMDEVIGNVEESYPMPLILFLIFVVTCLIYYASRKFLKTESYQGNSKQKWSFIGLFALITYVGYISVSLEDKEVTENNYANEIASNGIYSLFSAFKNNELDYDKFYLTYKDVMGKNLPKHKAYEFLSKNEFKKKNVIFIGMESMGADFMTRYGNEKALTPVLDELSHKSLNFNNMYATGTRTVTGLEALNLSIPPSPGKSIVKRQNNENLASMGFIFKDRGYQTKFIYGGYGYFDNMNYFFSNNGFDILDRSDLSNEEIGFANVWGVSDEYMFIRAIKEADKAYKDKKPFMYFIMTTSNHRPYTFPKNDAGIPEQGGGRDAGVRYADYAIGKFLKDAEKQPWFKDTVFAIVADHTAGASGKTSLPPQRYHITAMIYAPDFIKAQEVSKLSSQIDFPVTLLDILGFNYKSKFYGQSVLSDDFQERAFLTTNQKLGLYKNRKIAFIEPVKSYGMENEEGIVQDKMLHKKSKRLKETISYYQSASQWKQYYQKFDTTLIGDGK